VYSFFANKDDLFRQIFVRRGDEFMPELHAILAETAAGPVEQLHALVDFQIGFFRGRPHFGRLYLRYFSTTALPPDKQIDAVIQERYEEAMRLQADLFRRGQRSGVLHAGDPDVLARLLSGLVSAYQALDPEVVSDERDPGERLPLKDFHVLLDRTFVAADRIAASRTAPGSPARPRPSR